jgi:ribonuclease J
VANKDRIRGYVFTHGHEDHIGATPYVLDQRPAPIFGSRLTLALIENKLRERHINGIESIPVESRQIVQLGCFSVQFIRVNHSIAGAYAVAITSPAGTILFTGDFKIDFTPPDGQVTDLSALAAIGERGVLAMMCDSTNVEHPGIRCPKSEWVKPFVTRLPRRPGVYLSRCSPAISTACSRWRSVPCSLAARYAL